MIATEHEKILNQLMDAVVDCQTPEAVRRIARLKASRKQQSRVDDLASRANVGTPSESVRSEYERYIGFSQFVTLLQAKARDRLDETAESG